MSLWLCLRLAQLPLECLSREEGQPTAVVEQRQLLCINNSAAELGLKAGLGIAQAQALCGEQSLRLLARDPRAEQRALQRLACWAYSISPTLHSFGEHSLLLEIGGCLRLFGGVQSILNLALGGLAQRGHQVDSALAQTRKAAWLLSFRPTAEALDYTRPLPERLAPLPLSLLHPLCKEVAALQHTGLSRLGELLTLPGPALANRCGRELAVLLEQLLGHRHDSAADFRPPDYFADHLYLGYEVQNRAEMQPAIHQLLQALERFLQLRQLQTRQIDWAFISSARQRQSLRVRSSTPLHSAARWQTLSDVAMERIQLQRGVQTIALHARRLEALTAIAADLFGPARTEAALSTLPDQLRNRLGLQAIQYLQCRDEHLPELAVYSTPEPSSTGIETDAVGRERPFWLLAKPQPLSVDAKGGLYWQGPLRLLRGPERLEDYWWQQPCSRDYYMAEGAAGNRYWVFHERLQRCWYLHGLFV